MKMTIKFLVLLFVLGLGLSQIRFAFSQESGCIKSKCHENKKAYKYPHSALKDCQNCHVYENESKHKFTLSASGDDLCNMCHSALRDSKKFDHVSFAGGCTVCHDVHGSDNKGMLMAGTTKDLCTMCHSGLADKKFLHGPLQGDDCISCHNPHASNNPKFLAEMGSKLCVNCHGDLRAEYAKGPFPHLPAILNCLICHEPHSANYAKNLKKSSPRLCLSCHKRVTVKGAKATFVNSSVNNNATNCLGCHDPHKSKLDNLLKIKKKGPCPVIAN